MNKTIKIWGIPLLLGVFSLYGLVSALVGDGLWDYVSCVLLIIPILVILRFYFKKINSL